MKKETQISSNADRLAPIAIIAYNRPWHLEQTINALLRNTEASKSRLFIFSDAPRTEKDREPVKQVRKYLRSLKGFKKVTVVSRQKNYGLAKSVVSAVNHVLKYHKKVIILEDDLVTSPFFLQYMNAGLELYENDETVASIHGFFYDLGGKLPDTFFLRGTDCLGWGTWQRAWAAYEPNGQILLKKLEEKQLTRAFDYDGTFSYTQMLKDQIAGKISSWAIRWHAASYLKEMLTLNPGKSLVRHIGNDGSGTNVGFETFLDTRLTETPTPMYRIQTVENTEVRSRLAAYYRKIFRRPGIVHRAMKRFLGLISPLSKRL